MTYPPPAAGFGAADPAPLDPRHAPVPEYGSGSLADLLPAITAGMGLKGIPPTGLLLPPADRVCVFLVDGLGWQALRQHPAEAPFLTSLLPTSRAGSGLPLTAGFPSTTSTSLASVGTGRLPGEHGLLGYKVRDPERGQLMNQLRWEPWSDPRLWQPHPTVFQQAHAAGIATGQVSDPKFERTPLTQIALSGGSWFGRADMDERMDLAARRLAEGERSLVYTYYAELDGSGHRLGMDSPEWRAQLREVDRMTQRLAEGLPPGAALYITADHGMVDVPRTERAHYDFDEDWELRAGVALLGGEARARHVYAVPGAAADVHTVWREVLAEDAWVVTREEAIALGWFGPADKVEQRVRGRIGDVVVAMDGNAAVVATRSEPRESALLGMHGSMTPAEQQVPLLEVRR